MQEGILSRPIVSPLVRTRCVAPRLSPRVVPRPHLLEKLDLAFERRLTLVTAPSGYGKTTAVLSWLEAGKHPAAWLVVDESGIGPTAFWQYVFRSLEALVPGIGDEMGAVLTSEDLILSRVQVDILIDRLSGLQQDSFLVLDCTMPPTDPQVLKGLALLIERLPPFLHVVVVAQVEPALELSHIELRSQLLRIGPKDLRFRTEEIEAFFLRRGHPLAAEDVGSVERFSEGWPAALVAVAMSLEEESGTGNVFSRMTRCHDSIDRYLIQEVVGTWTPEKKSFLLQTSILDSLDEASCDALTGQGDARRMLEEMCHRGEFVSVVDEEAHAYRYHPLFQHVLQRLLLESDSIGAPELHARAAAWLLGKGRVLQAIPHFLDAGRHEDARILLEQASMYLAGQNDFAAAMVWLDRLPESVRDGSPRLAYFQALYHAKENRFDLARRFIAQAQSLLADMPDGEQKRSIRTDIMFGDAYLLIREGRTDELLALAHRFAADPSRTEEARNFFDFNRTDLLFCRCDIGGIVRLQGERSEGAKALAAMNRHLAVTTGYLPLAQGEYLYEIDRTEEALPHLVEALEAGQAAKCPGVLVPAMVDLARIRRAGGDFVGTDRLLAECADRLAGMAVAHWGYLVQACRARYALESGRAEAALSWAEGSRLTIYDDINRAREYEWLVLARVLMASNRHEDAELLLIRLLSFTQAERRRHSEVEVRCLLAVLAFRTRDMMKAMKMLEPALSIGMEEGFLRSFLDEGEPLLGVLKQMAAALRKRAEPQEPMLAYVRSLIEKFHTKPQSPTAARVSQGDAGFLRLLTAKERQVMELLFAALTNEEIATKLGIGLRTVKAHTGSIYGKLGVRNRAQCLKLIRDQHLLE